VTEVETYRSWFEGIFRIRREKVYTSPVEKVFSTPALAPRLRSSDPSVSSVVYTLESS